MKSIRLLLLALAIPMRFALAADAPTETISERGQKVAQAAFKELSLNLQQAIAKGGFTNAIEFCSEKAMPLTLAVAQKEGVQLKRLSHRPRNPANQADPRELALLKTFQESVAAGTTPQPVVEQYNEGAKIFYAPIVISNPLCLSCHGDPAKDIPADTLAAIKRQYQQDKATGFKLNDVRGMWRIKFPK